MGQYASLFRKTPRFATADYDDEPVAALRFGRSQVAQLQQLILNISRILNNPVNPPTRWSFFELDQHVRLDYHFAVSDDHEENVRAFVSWLRSHFLPGRDERALARLERYVERTYGLPLLEEFMRREQSVTIKNREEHLRKRSVSFGGRWQKLTPQAIFQLFYLHKLYVAIRDEKQELRIADSGFLLCKEALAEHRKGFNRKPRQMIFRGKKKHEFSTNNYGYIRDSVRIVIKSVKELIRRHPSANYCFLARDGIVFLEALLVLKPGKANQASLFYVSRELLSNPRFDIGSHALNKYSDDLKLFEYLQRTVLKPAIEEKGLRSIEAVVTACEHRLREVLNSNDTRVRTAIRDHLASDLVVQFQQIIAGRPEVVFFDSSSKTFPVLLAAFGRIYFPTCRFIPFFAITEYLDSEAGYLTGRKDTYITDFLSNTISYNKKRSRLSFDESRFKPGSLDRLANSFLAMLILYNEIYDQD